MTDFSFPWLATLRSDLAEGKPYTVRLDRTMTTESGTRNIRESVSCHAGVSVPMSDRDRVRLERYVAFVHIRKEDRDDYTVGDFQVFREERLFDFEPNPAHQPSAA